jgi:hypothetical protein
VHSVAHERWRINVPITTRTHHGHVTASGAAGATERCFSREVPVRPIEQTPEPEAAPTACPFCGSARIATTTEKVDASSYWRCVACGEMWNLGRLRASSNRYGERPRWK